MVWCWYWYWGWYERQWIHIGWHFIKQVACTINSGVLIRLIILRRTIILQWFALQVVSFYGSSFRGQLFAAWIENRRAWAVQSFMVESQPGVFVFLVFNDCVVVDIVGFQTHLHLDPKLLSVTELSCAALRLEYVFSALGLHLLKFVVEWYWNEAEVHFSVIFIYLSGIDSVVSVSGIANMIPHVFKSIKSTRVKRIPCQFQTVNCIHVHIHTEKQISNEGIEARGDSY